MLLVEIQQLQSHSSDKSFTAWAEVTAMMETAVGFETSWGVAARISCSLKIEELKANRRKEYVMFLKDYSFKINVFHSVFSMLKNAMQHSEEPILLFL